MGCPQPTRADAYDWSKLESELPVTSVMARLNAAWTWVGRIDQALVIVVVPLLIVLIVKVRRLEGAIAANQGGVNVAVAAPAMIPMQTMTSEPKQTMTSEPARPSAASFPTPGGDKSDHLYKVVFH